MTTACRREAPKVIETPWGEVAVDPNDTTAHAKEGTGEELIMLTISGPNTYYEYHGRDMGTNYLLCEALAAHLGRTVRIDVCRDTTEMLQRLSDGEGDVIAVPMGNNTASRQQQKHSLLAGLESVANGWLVRKDNEALADSIRHWYTPERLAQVRQQEQALLSQATVTRRIFPQMLSAVKGQISRYDHLFRKYAHVAGMPWTLLAAQCYQESCFDPKARSWAGAQGLMQIMPSTADHLGLPRHQLYEPEPNISAATRYMRELQAHFRDIANPAERLRFALAAYNGGAHHVRDAMALTKKYGGVAQRWSDVRRYILLLQEPRYYTDPVVRYGYMRGSETAAYVDNIMKRHTKYRTVKPAEKK